MTDNLNIPTYRPVPRFLARLAFVLVVAAVLIGIALLIWHRFDNDRSMHTGPVERTAATFAPVTTLPAPAIECDDFDGNGVACIDGHTGTEYVPRPTADPDNALDPGCMEDQAAVVGYDPDPSHGLTWICVTLDDWADRASLDRLDALTRERAGS